MTTDIDTTQWIMIILAGFLIGIFAVVAGGGMFFSMPFMQWLFPDVPLGMLVGNVRVGSLFRNLGSTLSTRRQIAYAKNFKMSALVLCGTGIGSSFIADLNQKWLFPAVVISVVLAAAAPRIAHLVTPRTFNIAAPLIGFYGGAFGAGTSILLVALLRFKYTGDAEIGFVTIQARFVELLLVIVSVVIHFLHGNLVSAVWIPWSIGALIGGHLGGVLLDKMGRLSGRAQIVILYFAFASSIIVAGVKFFE
jgi:uncharacterized membrane protein YfcA